MTLRLEKTVVGMIHVPALPGTPFNKHSMKEIIEICLTEAKIYRESGVPVIAIENMHDIPYIKNNVGPEITAAMAIVGSAVKEEFRGPVGIQILAGANKEALAVALSSNLDFIRAEGFVFGHVADEGYIESCAGELLRYRKQIGADHIQVFTDIKKKHSSHQITADIDIAETAHAAEFFEADGMIITGASTGSEVDLEELKLVKEHSTKPIMVGSGVTPQNVKELLKYADGLIVGSYFKKDGYWKNELDQKRIKEIMDQV